MKLHIDDKKTIHDVQKEFGTDFPYLRIEVFKKPHGPGAPTHKYLLYSNTRSIGECRTVRKKGTIDLNPKMTVLELEQKLNDDFGLSVQIFRQSGKVWLETTVTDSWTLEQQNNEGEALSNPTKRIAS